MRWRRDMWLKAKSFSGQAILLWKQIFSWVMHSIQMPLIIFNDECNIIHATKLLFPFKGLCPLMWFLFYFIFPIQSSTFNRDSTLAPRFPESGLTRVTLQNTDLDMWCLWQWLRHIRCSAVQEAKQCPGLCWRWIFQARHCAMYVTVSWSMVEEERMPWILILIWMNWKCRRQIMSLAVVEERKAKCSLEFYAICPCTCKFI